MVLGMVIHRPSPVYMCLTLGAADRSCGGRLLALVISATGLGAELEALEFVQVLSQRGVSMVVAVTTAHNMGAVRLMMYGGGPGGVRLRQFVGVGAGVCVSPRDDRM
jgi:hypothetical protein